MQFGLFPSTYVELINAAHNQQSTSIQNPFAGRYMVLYPYEARNQEELNLQVGDTVEVDTEVDGWFVGRKENDIERVGLFPANFVQPL